MYTPKVEVYQDTYRGASRDELTRIIANDARSGSLKTQLVLFWSNHFVTEQIVFDAPAYLYQQHIMRQTHAIGNFKDFVTAVGIDKAMLVYLNGLENIAEEPNENYARELYELFTLGVDNGYTQLDIQETARALTGYNTLVSRWGEIDFNNDTFDSTSKTIFGQTGNWNYDDVIRILFENKAPLIANYICGKLYKHFVSPQLNEAIVSELAQTFLDNEFEIAPVLAQLFKSEHFFDDKSIGTIIKNPTDLLISFQKELEMDLSQSDSDLDENVRLFFYNLNYHFLNPPNVAGWPGDSDWLDSISITERWLRMGHQVAYQRNADENIFSDFILNLFDANESDVEFVAREIVNYFLSRELIHEEEYTEAIAVFKSGVPESYFTNNIWNVSSSEVPGQVFRLLRHIILIPEFQLK